MNRLKGFFLFLFALGITTFAAAPDSPIINVTLDHQNALYQCGQKAVFKIAVMDQTGKNFLKEGRLTAYLTNDGRKNISKTLFDLCNQNPIAISGSMAKPGFLRLTAVLAMPELKKPVRKIYSAGFEPEKISVAQTAPEDFRQFWQKAISESEKIPLDLKTEKLNQFSNAGHTSYKLSIAAPGGRIYGFLCIPAGSGKHPLMVTVPGAGPGYSRPSVRNDVAVLIMNVHSYDPMIPGKTVRESYKELNKDGYYMYHGAPDRQKIYYYRAITGTLRMLNYVLTRPDINPQKVGYYGSSQGGAFGFILGGLFGKFQAIVCSVPAMCDHLGYKMDRNPGWPSYAANLRYSKEIEAMVPYYDAANFAALIKSPIRVIVGFSDTCCCPSSVYAAYNGIPSTNKTIINEIGMGHSSRPSYFQGIKWIVSAIRQ